MKTKTDRNKLILQWYYEDNLSTYAISEKLQKDFGEKLAQPNVWAIIKRDAVKYGYGENHG